MTQNEHEQGHTSTMMGRGSHRCLARFLIVWAILVLCGSVTGQEVETPPSSDDIVVEIEDHLDAMSDEQLIGMCEDRGFGIVNDDGELKHKDYVEAARRCLSMEDEMNAILNENPDLAAELEAEVERMKEAKERLEKERDQILAEKALLEEQLKKAGVDVPASEPIAPQLTLEEVLRESLTELFHKVASDFRAVNTFLQPVLRPVFGGLKMVAKHTGALPYLEDFKQKAGVRIGQLKVLAAAKIEEFKEKTAETPANQSAAGET
jgi:hypothetical protein